MRTNITCDNKRLLLTNTFVCADSESPIHINIDFRPEYNLDMELVFRFSKDHDADKQQKMDISTDLDNRRSTFTFRNASNPFGIGNLNPLQIATLGGRRAYMNFRFSRPEADMPYLFTYSIFLEEAVNE